MKIFFFIFSLLLTTCCYAQANERPKIGLVLSGGGAKAGAHIGVIQILEENNIPIDYVVGTSMGAVVGGLYASGYSGKQIETILTQLEWEHILLNKSDRDFTYYRRKRDDDIFLVKQFIGYKDGEVKLPFGIIQGEKLYKSYKKLTIGLEPIGSFDNLRVPFKAVATDLLTGNAVVIDSGDLPKAMYASMAVPGVFSPIEYNGTLLVDGGIANNLPVDIGKSMGADILIVVDIGAPKYKKDEIENFTAVLDQISNIQIQANVEKNRQLLSPQDILITPDLEGIGTSDFHKISQAIMPGKEAMLKKLATLNDHFGTANYKEIKRNDSIYINDIVVNNDTSLCDQTYLHYLPKPKHNYTPNQIDDHISRLYGLELFETIDYKIEDGNILAVTPHQRSWGPTYIQGVFIFATDFDGNGVYQMGGGITRTLVNSLAGEYRVFAALGSAPHVFAEWYQPITKNLAWFIKPKISFLRVPVPLYRDDEELAQYLSTITTGDISFGRNLGEWGMADIGYLQTHGSNRLKVGAPVLPENNFHLGAAYVNFEVDTFDSSYFPHEGLSLGTTYSMYRKGLHNDQAFDQFKSKIAVAQSYGKHTAIIAGRYDTTTKGSSPLNAQFMLGGLFRLSGLSEAQLFGEQAAILTGIYYYKFKDIRLIPNYPFPLYIGTSVEAGNTWETKSSLFKHSFRGAGSVFLGFDTIIGPFYFGYGFAENGRRALHLYMGKPI